MKPTETARRHPEPTTQGLNLNAEAVAEKNFDPFGVGRFPEEWPLVRRFHLRLMTLLPFGQLSYVCIAGLSKRLWGAAPGYSLVPFPIQDIGTGAGHEKPSLRSYPAAPRF